MTDNYATVLPMFTARDHSGGILRFASAPFGLTGARKRMSAGSTLAVAR